MLNKFKQLIYRLLVQKPKVNPNVVLGENTLYPFHAVINTFNESKLIFKGNNYIGNDVEISPNINIVIGYNTSIQHRCTILGNVEIGSNCLFATNVYMSSGKHSFDYIPELLIHEQDDLIKHNLSVDELHQKIIIGDDCWIGTNSVIMPGINIGKGCVVGANSVVTKNLPPYSIAVGSPSKVIKTRIEFKPPTKLSFNDIRSLPYFYSGFKLDNFIKDIQINNNGIYANSIFQVAMNYKLGQKIEIEIKSNTIFPNSIQFESQSADLSNNSFKLITFNIEEIKEQNLFSFKILSKENIDLEEKVVIIKNVSIK